MAAARDIKVGPDWEFLEVLDDRGGHWRYGRKGRAEGEPQPHVWVVDDKPTLTKRSDGRPLLRRDEEGLPEIIIVRLDHAVAEPIVGKSGTAGGGTFEFELVG
jgi:hypothetical protein